MREKGRDLTKEVLPQILDIFKKNTNNIILKQSMVESDYDTQESYCAHKCVVVDGNETGLSYIVKAKLHVIIEEVE